MSYLDEAKTHYEQSQGDVTSNFGEVLKEWAKIEAILAIAEQLERLNNKLDEISNYAGNAIRIDRYS